MLLVSVVTARWLVRRFRDVTKSGYSLGVGLVGLGLMILVEFTVVLWLRGLSVAEYFANRDPVSSSVYFASLGVFELLQQHPLDAAVVGLIDVLFHPVRPEQVFRQLHHDIVRRSPGIGVVA